MPCQNRGFATAIHPPSPAASNAPRNAHAPPAIALPLLLAALAGCASFPPHHPAKPSALAAIIPPPKFFLAKTAPPPAPGSPTVTRQVAEVIALQSRATPEKIAEARWTYDFSVFTFSVALDPSFTAKRYPKTAKFFMELNDLVEYVSDDLKDTFRDPHPFQVDPRIKRFVIAIPGYGYPSYHAARCALFERVLAQLDPARAAAFARVADMVEADRVFAGEHFPYSIAAGRELGRQIFDELEKNTTFRASVVQLRQAEWTPPPSARDSF